MRHLVIDSASEACSVALIEAGAIVDYRHEIIGRGHAERWCR
jgi:tRNA threonylcarbamoyladenosine biosynthesis protein TsaB